MFVIYAAILISSKQALHVTNDSIVILGNTSVNNVKGNLIDLTF